MNYILVIFTLVVLTLTMVGIAVLGTDRLFPARKTIGYIASDGIDLEGNRELPLIVSSSLNRAELEKISFSTALGGYNKDEVDELFVQLIAENERLRRVATDQTTN
ncbi:DivIVA domain-containing protein [Rothia aerolata]|uniref:Cell division protein DivIVA n=1 Tax=Rothia aerolata TaxID=1812262 RepID=A0A917IQQ2_9MICC|nr:DivIVA domain-containing protein [Rothia aerolata]GGH59872.1 hypothetical protein GCM10007359_07480 [Rothia aerolata]